MQLLKIALSSIRLNSHFITSASAYYSITSATVSLSNSERTWLPLWALRSNRNNAWTILDVNKQPNYLASLLRLSLHGHTLRQLEELLCVLFPSDVILKLTCGLHLPDISFQCWEWFCNNSESFLTLSRLNYRTQAPDFLFSWLKCKS